MKTVKVWAHVEPVFTDDFRETFTELTWSSCGQWNKCLNAVIRPTDQGLYPWPKIWRSSQRSYWSRTRLPWAKTTWTLFSSLVGQLNWAPGVWGRVTEVKVTQSDVQSFSEGKAGPSRWTIINAIQLSGLQGCWSGQREPSFYNEWKHSTTHLDFANTHLLVEKAVSEKLVKTPSRWNYNEWTKDP